MHSRRHQSLMINMILIDIGDDANALGDIDSMLDSQQVGRKLHARNREQCALQLSLLITKMTDISKAAH